MKIEVLHNNRRRTYRNNFSIPVRFLLLFEEIAVDPCLEESGTKLKIRFSTDSRINGGQKSGFSEISKKRLEQKRLTPRNKKKLTKIAFQIFVNFGLFSKESLLLLPFIRF
ncbi:hypothetical protein FNV40_05485 [Enterococcus durans]|nr:hypothetical protein FNV40_05485 [Enterococcus durans]